jgi:hypothetical protein
MYEVYMAEVLSRSERETIDRTLERRRVAIEREATAPPSGARVRVVRDANGRLQPVAPCVGCPA